MILASVMDEIASRLAGVGGLRAYGFPADDATPPFAVTGYPDSNDFDLTYSRGADRIRLPVIVAVGRVYDRTSRDLLSAYVDGAGVASVKAALESDTPAPVAYDVLHVPSVDFGTVTLAGIEYLAATFNTDIIGSGA